MDSTEEDRDWNEAKARYRQGLRANLNRSEPTRVGDTDRIEQQRSGLPLQGHISDMAERESEGSNSPDFGEQSVGDQSRHSKRAEELD